MPDRDDPGTIGRRVQQLRADRGLTQKQLAEPAYTPAYISTLEAGRVRASDEALRHIAGRLPYPDSYFAPFAARAAVEGSTGGATLPTPEALTPPPPAVNIPD